MRGVAHVTTSKIHASSAEGKIESQTIMCVQCDRQTFMNLDMKGVEVQLPEDSNSQGWIGVRALIRGRKRLAAGRQSN